MTGSFGYVEGWFSPVDGARPSFPGSVSVRTFRVGRKKWSGRLGKTPSVTVLEVAFPFATAVLPGTDLLGRAPGARVGAATAVTCSSCVLSAKVMFARRQATRKGHSMEPQNSWTAQAFVAEPFVARFAAHVLTTHLSLPGPMWSTCSVGGGPTDNPSLCKTGAGAWDTPAASPTVSGGRG